MMMHSQTVVMNFRDQKTASRVKPAFASSSASSVSSSSSDRSTWHRILTHLISSFHHFRLRRHDHHNCRHRNYNSFHVLRYPWHVQLLLLASSMLLMIQLPSQCHAVGYSYARFVGPVSGPERQILVRDAINGGSRVDYIAHPEYQFAYGVEDSETRVLQNRKESRNGDEVKGVYSLVDPDGTLRVVKYTADDLNGFQAEVITNGVATIHGQNDDNDGEKANGSTANWHVETGGNADDGHAEDEKHVNENNESEEYNENNNDGEDNDDYEEGDQVEEYEETRSVEANNADAYSDESDYY